LTSLFRFTAVPAATVLGLLLAGPAAPARAQEDSRLEVMAENGSRHKS
jgi:hypothetical protein